jgi:hypothetical protein
MWQRLSSGLTSYLALIDRLRQWQAETGQEVTVVTFNLQPVGRA